MSIFCYGGSCRFYPKCVGSMGGYVGFVDVIEELEMLKVKICNVWSEVLLNVRVRGTKEWVVF